VRASISVLHALPLPRETNVKFALLQCDKKQKEAEEFDKDECKDKVWCMHGNSSSTDVACAQLVKPQMM